MHCGDLTGVYKRSGAMDHAQEKVHCRGRGHGSEAEPDDDDPRHTEQACMVSVNKVENKLLAIVRRPRHCMPH